MILRGRPDAVYLEDDTIVVEEIKSVLAGKEAFDNYRRETLANFCAQLDIYCYLLRLEGKEPVTARLHLVNVADAGGERTIDYGPDFGEIALKLEKALSRIVAEVEKQKNHHLNLQASAEELEFPFPESRPHQQRMMDEAAAAIESGGRLMLSAPTGIGKTAGVLFPALITAFKLGKKVYFATSKTTQRHIVRDFVDKLKGQYAPFSALFLTARAKLCPQQAEVCQWEECPYLDGFAEKMTRFGLIEEMFDGAVLTGEEIAERVTPVKMCPFAVSLELAKHADLLTGDYNYVFDPRVFLRRNFGEGGAKDYIIIVDEAHNLPERVRGYYSPELSADEVEMMLAGLQGKSYSGQFFKGAAALLRTVMRRLNDLGGAEGRVELNLMEWGEMYDTAERLIMEYFLSQTEFGGVDGSDPLLKFLRDLGWFCKTALLGGGIAFLYKPRERILQAVCLDPGLRIRDIMADFHAVIAMSATLEPPDFFSRTLGLYDTAEHVSLPYPFPAENRIIRIVPDVSTVFKFRSRFTRRIAEIIDRTYSENPGGYFVFFPSYAFLRETEPYVTSPHIIQESGMSEDDRNGFLREVALGGKVFLAVMGGIFAEGVDYPGQLNGVIVAGPGLPMYCAETEMIRAYFDEVYQRGFEYAYVFPGMNRVIQAAGRLIRSETDRGTITLIGKRFLQEPYRDLIPRDWYVEGVDELVFLGDTGG